MQQPMLNPEDISDPTTAMNLTLALMAKAFKLNYSTPTNNNQRISSNLRNRQIARPSIANQIVNQNGNGNVVVARAEGNGNGDLDEIEEMDQLSMKQCGGTLEQNPATVEETLLLEKHDPPVVFDLEETLQLQLAQKSRLKLKELKKEIKPANYAKINQLLEVFVSQKAKSREELYFSNTSKMTSFSKSISIPNEEFSDDTSPSVARKFLNELYKILKDGIFPIVNQVDARVQNLEIQILKEAAKFIRDFKSLAKEVDESLAKHKALEYEIECLLKAVVNQDIMSIVQTNFVIDTLNLQTELDRMKEKLKTCIIKKEREYAVLWNNWYKICEECKYGKISYDKAYNDMQ
ncbi:hypothetical protein Tco_1310666 [Tanacetum coccineum]